MSDNENGEGKGTTRAIIAWFFYDWGGSAFPAVIGAYVFAPYFTNVVAENKITGTAQWGWALAVSGLIVGVTGPFLGAMADSYGSRKPWVASFTAVCVSASLLLWFVHPGAGAVAVALILFAVANTAFELCAIFYNAMLPTIATAKNVGRLSGWAWGFGNAGAMVALATVYLGLIHMDMPFVEHDSGAFEFARVSGPATGLWFLVFALPFFMFVPDRPRRSVGVRQAISKSTHALAETVGSIRKQPNNFRFLLARMFYTDGLTTMLAFAGIFATGTFSLDLHEILLLGIGLNAMAAAGAAGFGWVDDWIGPKRTLLICLCAAIVAGSALLLVETVSWFWILALALGLFFGPIYAVSRSLMVRLAPAEQTAQMFGLYALSGKATAFLGPLLLSWITIMTDSQRAGIATVIGFFLIGGYLLIKVDEGNLPDRPP